MNFRVVAHVYRKVGVEVKSLDFCRVFVREGEAAQLARKRRVLSFRRFRRARLHDEGRRL